MPMRRFALLAAWGAIALSACMAPPSPAQRVTDAARELNYAARFGRLDVAVEHTSPGARKNFLDRRSAWGREVRVLDVELAGLDMSTATDAMVIVDVSWMRMGEGVLRTTRLSQVWRDEDHGWQLVRERRAAGDVGLLGEPVIEQPREQHGDVHFPSRTIRAD